jgi:aryl-alcohol dehydrogenase-like predicted oxidoreductase
MEHRLLGRTGLAIAPVVLGTNVFGWTADEKTSFAVLDAFMDAGFNALDTADAYSRWVPGNEGGESETIIGNWMKARGNREGVVVMTKVGSDMGAGRKDLSAGYIEKAVEASLRRLQTDVIDLYQSHWHVPEAPYEETLGAFQRLIEAGKVRAIGTSNHDAGQLRAALDVAAAKGLHRYDTLQPQYNLYDRATYDGPLRDLCIAEDIGVITYYSLASGFLTGKYRSKADTEGKARGGGVAKYLDARGLRILAALDAVAAGHGAAPGEVALAWLIQREGVTAPIASATSVEQVTSLARAADLRLSSEDVAALDEASA